MIGQLLDGRYQVIQALGAGGFGQTFIAQDTRRPGSPVCVVKHLKPASTDPNFLHLAQRLFQSEAEVMEQLGNHQQIPRLLAYFEENQEFYLVQEFVEGHRLTDELRPGQRWTEGQIVELLYDVLGILAFLHSQGAIHRDIKPDNLIRRRSDSKLVLVDFGAVKQIRHPLLMGPAQVTATIGLGTPGYMASEQGQGKPRPSSDIYALGVIGVQAATGLRPHQLEDDPDTGELIWQHQAHLSPALTAILTKMVKCYFKERYGSAPEVLHALNQLRISYPLAKATHQPVLGPTPAEYNPPTGPVTASAYAPTQIAPSNGHSTSNSAIANGTQSVASGWEQTTQKQATKPTQVQGFRPVLTRVLKTIGWGTIAAAIAVQVMLVGRQVNPRLFNRLFVSSNSVSEAAKPTPTAKASPATPAPKPGSFQINDSPLLVNPLPVTPSQSPTDVVTPVARSLVNSNSASERPDNNRSNQDRSDKSQFSAAATVSASPAASPSPAARPAPDSGATVLAQAQQAAKGGRLLDAITIAQTIPGSSAVYADSQRAIAQWQEQLSKAPCPASYTPDASITATADSGTASSEVAFTNHTSESVSVTLYSPDGSNQAAGTWQVAPGERLVLGGATYGPNWGIQVGCSKIYPISQVSNLTTTEGVSVFETSTDQVL